MIKEIWAKLRRQRPVRYDAQSDIGIAVLTILREYVEDYDAGRLLCEHDEMDKVRELVEQGQRMADHDWMETLTLQAWLYSVAYLLPCLWD